MATEVTLASSAQDINIIAVIDTEWVKKKSIKINYSRLHRDIDPTSPAKSNFH